VLGTATHYTCHITTANCYFLFVRFLTLVFANTLTSLFTVKWVLFAVICVIRLTKRKLEYAEVRSLRVELHLPHIIYEYLEQA
jgi:hypothetical protein